MEQIKKKGTTRGASPAKKERRKRAAKALAAAGAIAGGTQAYAAPVRFDNPAHGEPGHFHWPHEAPPNAVNLDLALPASEQPGSITLSSVLQFNAASYGWVGREVGTNADVQVGGYSNYFLVGVGAGEAVPSGAPWAARGYSYYPGYGYSEIPEGQSTYLGVRFDTGSGTQYGWVGVVRTGLELEAFAWGYETDPGVPIAAGAAGGPTEPIPTVSEWGMVSMTLAMLAAGTWAFTRKKQIRPKPSNA